MTLLKTLLIITLVALTGLATAKPGTNKAAKKTTSTQAAEKITTRALIAGKVSGVKFTYNIPYLEAGRKEKLDLYEPATRKEGVKYPAIVMIHGGGWVGGQKDAAREVMLGTAFARAGYVAVSVEYLKGRGGICWPTNLMDCKNAVRWLRTNAEKLQIDPESIGVIGGSAGGHLALMVAYTLGVDELEPKNPYPGISSNVKACIDLYGITNVLTRQKTNKEGKPNGVLMEHQALFKESRDEAPEKWKLASPVNHVSKNSPPTFIFHGTADTTVDRNQSYELAEKLKEAGVEHRLEMIPGVGHSFTPASSNLPRNMMGDVMEFFDKHLR